MKPCGQCRQENQEDANYCYQCGNDLGIATTSSARGTTFPGAADADLWRDFIGPNADRYLQQFKKFGSSDAPRFALTWNWPAFLYVSFLWFLYRKMYLYAAVYAIGPMISAYLTGDLSSGIVWSVVAGGTGNYVYYWHCREHITAIKQKTWNDPALQRSAMKEDGGVQPYVIWVGVVLYLLFSLTMFKMLQDNALDVGKIRKQPGRAHAAVIADAANSSTPETNPNPARMRLPRNPQPPAFAPPVYRSVANSSATSS